jgi:CheY-like chemotaxis protein
MMVRTKIMIVEDEGIVALSLQKKLEKFDYDVPAIASSGEQAIQLAQASQPDLILLDIRLQGAMDGIEAAQRIYAQLEIPIVYGS